MENSRNILPYSYAQRAPFCYVNPVNSFNNTKLQKQSLFKEQRMYKIIITPQRNVTFPKRIEMASLEILENNTRVTTWDSCDCYSNISNIKSWCKLVDFVTVRWERGALEWSEQLKHVWQKTVIIMKPNRFYYGVDVSRAKFISNYRPEEQHSLW